MNDDLYDYIGCVLRISAPMLNGPAAVKLLAVEPGRILVACENGDDDEPIWLPLSDIKVGAAA